MVVYQKSFFRRVEGLANKRKLVFKTIPTSKDETPFYIKFQNLKSSTRVLIYTNTFGSTEGKVFTWEQVMLTDKSGEPMNQKHLDKLDFVQIIIDIFYDNSTKEKLLYFLKNERVLKLFEREFRTNQGNEWEYVLYLLDMKNDATRRWADMIRKIITDKQSEHVLDDDSEK